MYLPQYHGILRLLSGYCLHLNLFRSVVFVLGREEKANVQVALHPVQYLHGKVSYYLGNIPIIYGLSWMVSNHEPHNLLYTIMLSECFKKYLEGRSGHLRVRL